MRVRVELVSPHGEKSTLDIVDGSWAEPEGIADQTLGAGGFAIPGLVDSHAHFSAPVGRDWQSDDYEGAEERAWQALSAGVMLAFDKGWSDLHTIELIDNVGLDRRPEIEAAGIINAVEGGYWPNFAHELTDESFDDGIRSSVREGRGWVKLVGDWPRRGQGPMVNFDEEQLRRAVEIAALSGSRVAIHTMARDAPSMAVRAGVQSIEHGLFLDRDDLGLLGERSGMWVPTLIRTEAVVSQLGEASSGGKLLIEGLANVKSLMPEAAEAGVLLLAGTDVTVGAHDVAQEALKMADYGLSAEQALRAVTTGGYEASGRTAGFEPGAPADAVLLPANPLLELGVLAHPTLVIRRGQVLR